jgi:GNAT superfamily N-acetyltransferase
LIFQGQIEPLTSTHDRRNFSCGVDALDVYLRRFARQHADSNVSRTYVATDEASIHGFYTLTMSAIRKENLAPKHLNRFPNFPLPVARLARLAVDKRHQHQGLGELLLADCNAAYGFPKKSE